MMRGSSIRLKATGPMDLVCLGLSGLPRMMDRQSQVTQGEGAPFLDPSETR